jgi:alpha-L-fucosidase
MQSKHDPRLGWFDQARFGMFVHFGIYAQFGRGEWVQYHEKIPRAEYEKLMHTFNPSRFAADAWVNLAHEAGCRYMTVTAKHHDGFCLFDSALTAYKITNTPFTRDLVRELVEACRGRGMRIIFYYSQPDWHHPNFVHLKGAFKDLDDPPPDQQPDWPRYLAYCHGQIRELCTNYGPIDGIWFDGVHKSERTWQGRKLYRMIKRLQPHAVVNDRARCGDFFTPERSLGEELTGYLFEACQSISAHHWGYTKDSPQFAPVHLIESLVRLAASGGNFLLNVGPKPDGTIPEEQAQRMRAIGQWLRVNGAAIYGTQAGRVLTGSPDVLTTRGDKALYVHLCRWPASDRLMLPGVRSLPERIHFLGREENLTARLTPKGLEIPGLPMFPLDPAVNVLALRFAAPPKLELHKPVAQAVPTVELRLRGATVLPVSQALREGRGPKGALLKLAEVRPARGGPCQAVVGWMAPEQRLRWRIEASRAGLYDVRIRLGCAAPYQGSTFEVRGKSGVARGVVRATPGETELRWQDVEALRVPKGRSELALRPLEMPYGYVFAKVAALALRRTGRGP